MSILAEVQSLGAVTAATGTQEEAIANVAAGEAFIERHEVFIGADGLRQIGGFAQVCVNETNATARLASLLNTAYLNCMDRLPPDTPSDRRWRMVVALPLWVKNVVSLKQEFQDRVRAMDFARVNGVDFVFGDKVAGFQALHDALEYLSEDDSVLWACADTLVAPIILDARAAAGLAHIAGAPYNVVPGEGAVVALLTREGVAEKIPFTRVRGVALGTEQESPDDKTRGVLGRAMTGCIAKVLENLAHGAKPAAYLCDLNGERYRAEEMALIMATYAGEIPAFEEPITPFAELGDLGVATAGVFAVITSHLPNLTQPHVLLTAAETTGARSAALFDQVT